LCGDLEIAAKVRKISTLRARTGQTIGSHGYILIWDRYVSVMFRLPDPNARGFETGKKYQNTLRTPSELRGCGQNDDKSLKVGR
jgi:hypothetical protein